MPPTLRQRRPPGRTTPPFPRLAEALAGAERVAIIGVGSELRGDDVAGVFVARQLASWCRRVGCTRLAAFATGAAPENFSGEVVRFRPDCVVFVDAAHLPGCEPGAVEIVAPDQVAGLGFSTHMLPAPIFLDYLEKMTGCRSIVVGIQLEQKDVMARPSPAVAAAVRRLTAAFRALFAPGAPP